MASVLRGPVFELLSRFLGQSSCYGLRGTLVRGLAPPQRLSPVYLLTVRYLSGAVVCDGPLNLGGCFLHLQEPPEAAVNNSFNSWRGKYWDSSPYSVWFGELT